MRGLGSRLVLHSPDTSLCWGLTTTWENWGCIWWIKKKKWINKKKKKKKEWGVCINASLTSSELPTPLKLATVSPIFKNGDPSLATQYRPISLLPLVSKLLEKVVARQLRSYLEEFSIIPKEQFAYRQHHSTEDALVYAINNFLMAKDQGLYTGLVFVDMSKAFDRVEHQTLINDLSNIGVRGSALKWFINRQQQVRCGNTVSAPTSCSRGVPQGSVLGPLLFLLYTRKVPEVLSATKTIKSVLFADDILIYCSGKTPTTLAACLSEAATRLGTWLTERVSALT